MTQRPEKKLFPNPFYVLLLLASTLFVLTVMGYLVSPIFRDQAVVGRPNAGPGSMSPAEWFDRHGPTALGAEIAVMIVSGLLAVVSDRWFPSRPARERTPNL
jgi:hypothetical protein